MRPPSLSFRGAKRRGNLKQALTISPGLSCVPGVYCEIAAAPAEPRNDKSDSLLHPEGRNDKAESLLLALITSRTRQNRNQPLEIATFPIWKTDPPIQDSSSLSAHLSFCGTNSLSASHARLLLSHPALFQNKLIYEHDIALYSSLQGLRGVRTIFFACRLSCRCTGQYFLCWSKGRHNTVSCFDCLSGGRICRSFSVIRASTARLPRRPPASSQ